MFDFMKLGKFEIGGPNWAFWLITVVAAYTAFSEGSWTPVLWWFGFVVVSLLLGLLGLWLTKRHP
jgi:hypothetical protein